MTVYTLTAVTGAFALTGSAAALTVNHKLDVSTGVFALTGHRTLVTALGVPMAGGVGTHDVLTYAYSPGATITESLRLHPSDAQAGVYTQTLSDLARLSALIQAGLPVSLTSGVGLHDALALALALGVAEKLFLHDAMTPNAKFGIALADLLKTHDSLARFLGGVISDSLMMTTVITATYQAVVAQSVGIGLNDALSNKLLISVKLADGVDLADSQILNMIYSGNLSEGMEISAAFILPDGTQTTFTTWAINTRTNAVTEYQNYAFASMAQMGSKYLGANATGLYELDGERDGTANIIAQIQSGQMSLGGSHFTAFQAAYIGMATAGDYVLKLIAGDGREYVYGVKTQDMATTRVNFGRGLRSRYFAFNLTGTGADFDLDDITFIPLISTRRV